MRVVLLEDRKRVYKTWTASAGDGETLARNLEAHLNEFADHVVCVSYAVQDEHHVLVVYIPIETGGEAMASAVTVAEHILDSSSP